MSELSAELVRAALLLYAEEELEWGSFSEFINYTGDSNGKTFDVAGLGEVKIVDYNSYDSFKNYDGWSEELWIVFEVQGTLYKITGTHTSYTGSEWANKMTIVVPKTKTVTYFEENE